MQERLGLGVIGVGMIGRKHARTISELDKVKLVAVADINRQRAEEVAKKYGAEAFYTDYREMLGREDIEAVVIATPDQLHREPAVAAAEARKHILLEKPMASTLEDADAISAAAKKAGVKLMIGYILRFDLNYVKIKQAVDSESFGIPLYVYAREQGSIGVTTQIGARVPFMLYGSIHEIDQLLWYLQDEAEKVYAEAVRKDIYRRFQVPDCHVVIVKFKGGATGCIEGGWAMQTPKWKSGGVPGWGAMSSVEVEVIGTKGYVNFHGPPNTVFVFGNDGFAFPDTEWYPVNADGKLAGAIRDEHLHFVDCILNDKEPLATDKDGRDALEIALAANQSIETGDVISLPLK